MKRKGKENGLKLPLIALPPGGPSLMLLALVVDPLC